MNASLLVCLALILPIGAIRFADDSDLYAGDPCRMEDDSEGHCISIRKCPMRIREVQTGTRAAIFAGRCSFDGFDEIVCCPKENIQPVVPLSITELPLATIPSSSIKSTEIVETSPAAESTTIIDRSPESAVTMNYFTMTTTTSIDAISENTPGAEITPEGSASTEKASMDQNAETCVETSGLLGEKTTKIMNLVTEASSPVMEILTSTASSGMAEMGATSSSAETTKFSDDRFGARPSENVNQTAEATLGTSAPFSDKLTTINANPEVETISPLVQLLTPTVRPNETEIKQLSELLENLNSSPMEKATTVETPIVDTMSPLMEILTSTVANRSTEPTTQASDLNDNGNGIRPAEAACNEYKKGFLGKDGKITFLIPILIGEPILKPGEFPFMAALGYKINKDNSKLVKYKCGGTLITERHILTAAHCVSNADSNVPVEVRLGNVNSNDMSSNVQILPVGDVIVHPSYKIGLTYNNIAIIKLSTAVVVSQHVMPICLQYTFIPNLTMSMNISRVITGWGVAREESNDLSEFSRLRLIEKPACNEFYKNNTSLAEGIDESIICLKDENIMRSSTDSCQGGSSGVPLVQVNRDSINVIGVELLSQDCGSDLPGVYANTFNYLDWIEKVVWPDTNVPAIPMIDPDIDVRISFED